MVYIPESHLEVVKQAMFDAGAGHIGNYSHCCWQSKGLGQFKPLDGSTPHIGSTDTIEYVDEYRVELIYPHESLQATLSALKHSHPYEEPAFDVIRLELS